ncbi:MAG: hypothetical protein U0821_26150 [Chloroflexota bacterium]
MGFLDKLFGRSSGGAGMTTEAAISSLVGMYDQPDVKAEGGLSITGPHANEVRNIGKALAKAGGKPALEATLNGVREKVPWCAKNIEAIWSALPEWRN